MNIKVCGLTQLKQLQQLDALNVAFAGLIFHKDSPRYVIGKIAKDELKDADFDLKKVGVFVNADYDEILIDSKKSNDSLILSKSSLNILKKCI